MSDKHRFILYWDRFAILKHALNMGFNHFQDVCAGFINRIAKVWQPGETGAYA